MPVDAMFLERIMSLITDSGGVDRQEMSADMLLIDAIDPDNSVGLLDFQFRCEREFQVPIRFTKTIAALHPNRDGTLRRDSIERMQQLFPSVDPRRWAECESRSVHEVLTVGDTATIVADECAAAAALVKTLTRLVARVVECEEREITRDSRFCDLGVESLDVEELAHLCEQEFGVAVTIPHGRRVTVGEFCAVMTARLR